MLALRHLRIGYWGLLLFLTLGLALEALHGFKLGLYLDVENEPRRLAWRLAHAHGTLLSVLHVVFGLTLGSRHAPTAATAQRASGLLSAATILLPGGFFLGGLFVHDGDPGVGVLLVPLGALALFGAIYLTARGLTAGVDALELREIAFGSPDYDASVVLRTRVLREPLRLWPTPEEREGEATLRHLGAFEGGRLVACLMLHDVGDGKVRMRQVAVDFDRQKSGIGTRLVHFSEEVARAASFSEMVLHARKSAVPFYERLGYSAYGEPFVEVTVPHIAMKMRL
jgi:predicted GNAT family N-acyltransferase